MCSSYARKKGVATEMKREFPNLVVWHCCSYRLELAVSDMRNEVQGINHFHSFFDKLYSLYSMSPKNQRELTEYSSSLSQKLKTIGKIFTIRWVAPSCRAVKAVWDSYSALATHFSQAQEDTTTDSKERAKYQDL